MSCLQGTNRVKRVSFQLSANLLERRNAETQDSPSSQLLHQLRVLNSLSILTHFPSSRLDLLEEFRIRFVRHDENVQRDGSTVSGELLLEQLQLEGELSDGEAGVSLATEGGEVSVTDVHGDEL